MRRTYIPRLKTKGLTLVALAALGLAAIPAGAQINDFGSGFVLNGSGGTPTISTDGSTLTVTTNAFYTATSAFDSTPQGITQFSAAFTYQYSGSANDYPGDGVAFVLQDDPSGDRALGSFGGYLGYAGIANSAAIELNIYAGHVAPGTALGLDGSVMTYTSTLPVDLLSGDPIRVGVNYTGTTLTETLTDAVAGTALTQTYTGVDLPGTFGSNSAFVGFTGGTGTAEAVETVSNFSFSAAPEPSQYTGLGLGVLGLAGLALKARRQIRTA
jgi:MYXO-CTERM domain-containing protein